MRNILVLLLVIAAAFLLLTAAAFATENQAEELMLSENTEVSEEAEVLVDGGASGEASDEVQADETPADETAENPVDGTADASAGENTAEKNPAADASAAGRQTGWVRTEDGWYFYNTDGSAQTGWTQYHGGQYYLDPEQNGKMAADTVMTIDGADYRFAPSGVMVTGWYADSEGNWYCSASDGVVQTGWIKYYGGWYYLDPAQNGKMVVDTVMTIEGADYRFLPSGAMYTGWYLDDDGNWYYYDYSGILWTGWVKYYSNWYYMDPAQNGKMVANTTMTIDGAEYRFLASGAMYTGWYLGDDGNWYYYTYGGNMQHGWLKSGSSWYYMDPDTGAMATGVTEIGGDTYWMNSNGVMCSGCWKYYNDSWHYFTRYGHMAKGWIYLPENGGNYYFYDDGSMAAGTTIDGIYINASGVSSYYASNMTERVQGYTSPTDYLLVVDRSTCKFYIYQGSAYNWSLYDWSYCACGAYSTPTPSGTFYLQNGGPFFDSGSSRCFWYRDIVGNVAFHSILYYQNGSSPYTATIMSSTVGARVSHGCVRLPFAQNKWVYDNAPSGTTVVIF